MSDASCRIVDNAFERFFIVLVERESEIGDDVLYLFSLIEGRAAINAVWQPFASESFFETAALRVCPVEDYHLVIGNVLIAHDTLRIADDDVRLVGIAVRLRDDNALSYVVLAEYVLVYLPLIVVNQAVGRRDDVLSGAIVLFELKEP